MIVVRVVRGCNIVDFTFFSRTKFIIWIVFNGKNSKVLSSEQVHFVYYIRVQTWNTRVFVCVHAHKNTKTFVFVIYIF